ncbi:hypothetical protein BDZ90DRAFT_171438 [Jaminaea rosea]|uniref:Uncharacterized protein n=1 Tax=Jaminaea rosea TaxID=1569628 RepID=A0A316UR47_9BASI|nr:hypothetical protein BDZ90DRAFT_171438 [Jaminaea rosea]PWN27772.1 hypothetical protein BDZ90DRAFT_171438 [Jaminaea rosea]
MGPLIGKQVQLRIAASAHLQLSLAPRPCRSHQCPAGVVVGVERRASSVEPSSIRSRSCDSGWLMLMDLSWSDKVRAQLRVASSNSRARAAPASSPPPPPD